MDPLSLYSYEQPVFYGLALLVVGIPLINWLKSDPILVWSPITMISIVFFYYSVVGPYLALINGDTYYRLLEHRPYFYIAWTASLISYVSIIAGFHIIRKPGYILNLQRRPNYINSLKINYARISMWLIIIAAFGLIVIYGTGGIASQLDVFNASPESGAAANTGAFRNYFLHMMNLLTGASCYFLIATLKRKRLLLWFILIVLIVIAIYTKHAFRWRHLTLGISLIATYYIFENKKINVVLITGFAIVGLIALGFIQETRRYGTGLIIDEDKTYDSEELLMAGFKESTVFMTTGLLIATTEVNQDFIGWDPVIQSFAMPIPRMLWPGKPSGDYISKFHDLYRFNNMNVGFGVAVLNIGEYFLMFGFLGMIVGCMLIGISIKYVWIWFLKNRTNPLAIVAYAVFFSYLYVVISRGYLPQVVMLFMFTVFPLFWIFNRKMKQVKRNTTRNEGNTALENN